MAAKTHKLEVITATDIDKQLNINTIRKPLSHKCSQCGKGYFRRNLTEMWTMRNPGKRFGWHKEIGKICLQCMDVPESNRITAIADIQYGKIVKIGKRT